MNTSLTAAGRHSMLSVDTHNVVVLAFDEVTASDVCGLVDVFSVATKFYLRSDQRPYKVTVASVHGQPITSFSGIGIATTPLSKIDPATIETLIVPGGAPPHAPPVPQDVVDWLAREGGYARRLCGICTGTFLLAAAGLIRDRKVTTHWQSTDTLRARHPALHIDADRVYLHDRGLWTSGGFTAGMDLALALLEEDHGHATAMEVASSVLVFVMRPGEQAQVSATLSSQAATDRRFSHLHAWVLEHLADDLRVEVLAEQAGMTVRTFSRHYSEQTGLTPARSIEIMRLEAALRALHESDASLKQVARNCGFGDEQNLRRAFLRLRGTTPEQYRQQRQAIS